MSWGIDDDELEEDEEESEETEIEEEEEVDDSEESDGGGWGQEVRDLADGDDREGADDDEQEVTFEKQFKLSLSSGGIENINSSTIEENIDEIEDVEALQQALDQDSRTDALESYNERLDQLTEDDTDEDDDESEVQEIEIDNLSNESEGDTSDDDEEVESAEADALDIDSGDITTVDIGDVAPNAMSTQQATEMPYLWRILGWAEPGKGKTHFGYTMPQPVCIIDTEGKAHNLASKFDDVVTYIWQPNDYDEAREALDEAISVLHRYLEQGHRGTIVVDSMSEMWEWSKQKYVSKAYNGKSLDEVNLSSNMGRSGESDWKVIKRYHNKRFREVMVDTPFHIYWTAMQTDDYEAIMEGESGNPKKPVGERDNTYKIEQVLRFQEGDDGAPVGQLQKNGLSKYSYTGLRYPTFPKHQQVCDEILEAEEDGNDPMLEGVYDGEVTIVEGNSQRFSDD